MTRQGDWFQTISGMQFYPLDPRPEDIRTGDIAHGLSMICRFGGHVREFYSVAQHSVLVSHAVPPRHALWGLLHDATEAYLGDMIRPLKLSMPAYQEVEKRLEAVIAEVFNLPMPMPREVKHADNMLLMTERRDLLPVHREWSPRAEPLPGVIVPWTPARARAEFMDRFVELVERGDL